MSVELSQQKIDLSDASDFIRRKIAELEHQHKVLIRGMEELDNGEDMMKSKSLLAQEVRKIMSEINY